MTKGRRTTIALLAVVAVLLGLNLLRGTPEAEAQMEVGLPFGACCLPDGSCTDNEVPATCQLLGGIFQGGVSCVSVDCTPLATVVAGQTYSVSNGFHRVWRFWSDGTVDTTHVHFPGYTSCNFDTVCGPVSVIPLP